MFYNVFLLRVDVLRLPIPEIVYSAYSDDPATDVFVLENLLSAGYESYKDGDLEDETLLKSCLECLAQLHGTGIAYKLHLGGADKIMERFPKMEEQAQIKVALKAVCFIFLIVTPYFRIFLTRWIRENVSGETIFLS